MDKTLENEKTSEEPKTSWTSLVLLIVLNDIFSRTLDIWLPTAWALSVSFFVTMVMAYPIARPRYRDSFLKWCLRIFLYAVAVLLLFLILNRWVPAIGRE